MRKNAIEALKNHDTVIQQWDSDMVKQCAVNPGTVKYTGFLLATTSDKVERVKAANSLATPFERTKLADYILGAMVPCVRLYADLGKELLPFLDQGETTYPYKSIVDSYGSQGFEELALQNEEWLDKLSVTFTSEELDIIEKLYEKAMKLVLGFPLAQPLDQKSVIPIISREHNPAEYRLVIFFNFDQTCTVVNSSAILAEMAIISAPKSDENIGTVVRMLSADLRSTWGDLSKQYTEEYEQCIDTMLLTEKAENFDYERLHKVLEQLSDFEKRANTRVSKSGVLKGLKLEDIKRAGELMLLQDGYKSFLQSIIQNEQLNADIHVLSYCWCGDLIRSAFSSGGLDVLNVHANEFIHEENLSTGEIVKKVETPIDKLQACRKILNNYNNDKNNLTVQVGDSPNDLLCLLQADISIVLNPSTSLKRVRDYFGVSFIPLFPGIVEKQKIFAAGEESSCWNGLSGVLYTISSWAEIHAVMLGS
ncbi:bifunctional TH2 protein, mitochondrial-like isoform X3 [Lycium barbarum]|nr:bifunctional TH2 protein, mitochondrial-like isoform X3 [Lycium barbarum]